MSRKVVTKDPKRQKRGKKSHETYMKRLKEKILEDNQLSTSFSTDNSTPSTPSHPARYSDAYVYGVGILAVLAIVVCVFFAYNTSLSKNKKLVNEKQDQPPKRLHML